MRSLEVAERAALAQVLASPDPERLRTSWFLACTLGEAIGIGFAASLVTVVSTYAPAASSGTWLGAYVAIGAVEGTALGALQYRVLRQRLPRLRPGAFVGVTALIAIACWAGAAYARASFAQTGGGSTPGIAALLGLSVLAGAAAGSVLGAAQALVLRQHARHCARFIVYSAGGWAAAMPLIFLGASVCALGWALPAIAAVGVISGALAGPPLGSMTWMFVGKLEPR